MTTLTFILVIGVIWSVTAQRKREDILGGLAAFLLLSGRVPWVAYRQSATSSFLATATIATRLFRLLLPFVRATNHAVISLPVWKRIQRHASWTSRARTMALPALLIPCSCCSPPLL